MPHPSPKTSSDEGVAPRDSRSVSGVRARESNPDEGSPPSLRPGDVIGRHYRLDSLLGVGGMGSVWRARHLGLDIDLALKVVRPEVQKRFPEAAKQRLLQEARVAARLEHPAFVRISELGETEAGDPFIVMDLLEGMGLEEALVQRGHVAPERAVAIVLPILEGLRVAHGAGVYHRDIKPENIILANTSQGVQPKLIDFGIARRHVAEGPESQRLTQPGAVMGSPRYMSPEQARGDDPDHRADLWATTVVLYELVAGVPPFSHENRLKLLRLIIDQAPTSLADLGVVDAELGAIVDRGLAKAPEERWESADALGSALARWLMKRGIERDACGNRLDDRWLGVARDRTPEDILDPRLTTVPSSRGEAVDPRTSTLPAESTFSVVKPPASKWRRGAMLAAAAVVVLGAGWVAASYGPAAAPDAHEDAPALPAPALPAPAVEASPVPAVATSTREEVAAEGSATPPSAVPGDGEEGAASASPADPEPPRGDRATPRRGGARPAGPPPRYVAPQPDLMKPTF